MADSMIYNPGGASDDGDPPRPCCLHLRSKSLYYRDDERPGRLHVDEAMGYWCNLTNDPIGPDGHAATHGRCQPGRQCFVAGT
ncbi:MAG: hypothetical protein Kow0059_02380 [Candidatus Sumerlaeia bacterium]